MNSLYSKIKVPFYKEMLIAEEQKFIILDFVTKKLVIVVVLNYGYTTMTLYAEIVMKECILQQILKTY